jgi:cytochrome c6
MTLIVKHGAWDCRAIALLLALAAATSASAQDAAIDAELANAGRALFQKNCLQCHGVNMVTAGVQTYDLRKFPLDQKERFVQSVTKGKGNMPALGERFASADIDALFEYVKTRGKPVQ